MAGHKKNYTNADIIKEVGLARGDIKDVSDRVTALEGWKQKMDWTKEAVDEYKRQEAADKSTTTRQTIYNGIKELLPYISLILAGLAAIVYAHASSTK